MKSYFTVSIPVTISCESDHKFWMGGFIHTQSNGDSCNGFWKKYSQADSPKNLPPPLPPACVRCDHVLASTGYLQMLQSPLESITTCVWPKSEPCKYLRSCRVTQFMIALYVIRLPILGNRPGGSSCDINTSHRPQLSDTYDSVLLVRDPKLSDE